MKVTPRTLKGFRDFLPKEIQKRQYALKILKEVFESYGFEPLETPVLEYEEILTGKYGEEGDKLMYKFEDNGGRKVAIRYDQTVPLARVVAQYQNDLPLPFKRYQIQNVYRAENTQKGRFREFLQVDIDNVGSSSPLSDAEVLALIYDSYKKLGFKTFTILINDRLNFLELSKKGIITQGNLPKIVRALDKLKKIGKSKILEEMVLAGLESGYASYVLQSFENMEPNEKILSIINKAEEMGVEREFISFTPTLARGLDYYTGLIIEVETEDYPTGSLGGGGRYDNLVGMFSANGLPAVGFAFGFDRIIEAMDSLDLFPVNLNSIKVLVTTGNHSIKVAKYLREKGINTQLYTEEKELDKQLKYADKKAIPYVIIVSEANIRLKNMVTGDQLETSLEDLPDAIR